MRKFICVICVICGQASSVFAARTVTVTNPTEMQAAWRAQAADDLRILVAGAIDLEGHCLPPIENQRSLELIGVTDDACLRFSFAYADTTGDYPGIAGLQYRGRDLTVVGLGFRAFQGDGAALRIDRPESARIYRCWFEDVGQVVYPPRVVPPQTARDVVITHCIGAFEPPTAVEVIDCEFRNCCTNSVSWSHCLYLTPRAVRVVGCRFVQCGSPLALKGTEYTEVIGCTFEAPTAAYNQMFQRWDRPYVYILNPGPVWFIRNRIAGPWDAYMIGHRPDPAATVIDWNDLAEMRADRWAAMFSGPPIEAADWVYDGNSKRPATRPAEE